MPGAIYRTLTQAGKPNRAKAHNPVTIKRTANGGYMVTTPHGVKAANTTKTKAESQKRLLNAIEHGYKPSGRK